MGRLDGRTAIVTGAAHGRSELSVTPVSGPMVTGLLAPLRPHAYVYADLSVQGGSAREAHWRGLAARLAEQGAPPEAIATLADRYARAPVAPAVLASFAAGDGTLAYEQFVSGAPIDPVAGFAAPPPLRPLLRWRQDRPPFVLVVIDRAGADLTASAGAGGPERRWSITGPDDEIVKHALGGCAGLAQSRLQHRATDSWRHNAKSAAQQVVSALDGAAASVLIVSGDVRAVQLLLDQLPHRPGLQVRRIHGSRAFDGSQPSRSRRVAYELRDAAAEQVEVLVATFREQLAPGGRAVNGLRDVVAALAAGSVETLLIGATADGRRVCFGARATDIFADRLAALESGVPLCCGPAPDAVARAALLVGARVCVLPDTLASQPLGGFGAICRYAPRS